MGKNKHQMKWLDLPLKLRMHMWYVGKVDSIGCWLAADRKWLRTAMIWWKITGLLRSHVTVATTTENREDGDCVLNMVDMDLMQELVVRLADCFPDDEEWLYFISIGEEAGEVQGAYCKWRTARRDKVRTHEDILEEMGQLIGCIFLAAYKLGYGNEEILRYCRNWLTRKSEEVSKWK